MGVIDDVGFLLLGVGFYVGDVKDCVVVKVEGNLFVVGLIVFGVGLVVVLLIFVLLKEKDFVVMVKE